MTKLLAPHEVTKAEGRTAPIAGAALRRMMNNEEPFPVTVVIPVKNEEKNLVACLAKIRRFVEVLVVDSDSSDQTRTIAEHASAKILDFKWQGGYPKKRNWVLLNYPFKTPWVLFLDADEHLTEAFYAELPKKLNEHNYAGFWLIYRNYFLGKILKYGVPQKKLALFRVGSGLYERIDDRKWTQLDMEVHEHPILSGSIGEINAPIDHLDCRDLHQFFDRHNAYSTWEAKRYIELRSCATNSFTERQEFKYRHLERWWFPMAYFALTYFFYRGFLDGRAGFTYAIFKSMYFFQVQQKIREIVREKTHSEI
jgi:glycosyltransferase involved in cell wall biosynthesis